MRVIEYICKQGGEAYVLWMGLEPWLVRRRLEPRLGRRLLWRLARLARRLVLTAPQVRL